MKILAGDPSFLQLKDDGSVSTSSETLTDKDDNLNVDVALEAITGTPVDERDDDTYIIKEYTTDNNMYAHVYILGYCEEKTVESIVELLEGSKEKDIIMFHLSNCYICQVVALLSSMAECDAHIVTYGHTLPTLDAVMVWAQGKERNIGEYSRFIIGSHVGFSYGPIGEMKDSTEETERMDELFFNKLLNIELITKEEREHIKKTKSTLTLFGENLSKRIK